MMTNDRHWARLTTRARIVGETPDSPLDPAGAKGGICPPTINSETSEASDPTAYWHQIGRTNLVDAFLGDNWPQSAIDRAVQLFNETMAEDKAVGPRRTYAGMASRHHQRGPLVPAEIRRGFPCRYCGGRLGARFPRQASAFY
jgi:hypothetical protein